MPAYSLLCIWESGAKGDDRWVGSAGRGRSASKVALVREEPRAAKGHGVAVETKGSQLCFYLPRALT